MSLLAIAVYSNHAMNIPLIIGHRGASHDAPENTLGAFHLAFEQGADGIEGDFRLTRDGQIVCIHDATLQRTAGVELQVAKATFDDLRQLDVGRWKGERWAGEQIPTLGDVFAVAPPGKLFFMEVKCGAEIVPPLQQQLAKHGLPLDQFVLISFHDEVIAAAKRAIPGLKACLIVGYRQNSAGTWMPGAATILQHIRDCQADGLNTQANLEVVTTEFLAPFRQAGLQLHSWTIDTLEIALPLCRAGIQSLTSNRPGALRAELARAE